MSEPVEPSTFQKLSVGGMTCMGCVRRVTEVLTREGANHVEVDLARGEARFEATPAQAEAIRKALDADGWDVAP